MKSICAIRSASLLALLAVFASTGCANVGSEEDGPLADDIAGSEEDIGETEDELVYSCSSVSTWPVAFSSKESEVLTLVNQRRAAGAVCGEVFMPPVPALTLNTKLRCAARSHSKDMGVQAFFSHTGSDGTTFDVRLTQAGYSFSAAGENIAAGQGTAEAAVNSWMKSAGHCKNIMNAGYKHIGIGYYYKSNAPYKNYWTQTFGKP